MFLLMNNESLEKLIYRLKESKPEKYKLRFAEV